MSRLLLKNQSKVCPDAECALYGGTGSGARADKPTAHEDAYAGFPQYALYPNLTVYENLAFGLAFEGVDTDTIDAKVRKTAAALGLSDCLEKFPRSLSAEQCGRAAYGRTLIRGAKA